MKKKLISLVLAVLMALSCITIGAVNVSALDVPTVEIAKYTSRAEVCNISSFPSDYDFGNEEPHYICGMSVPPVMMAQIASRVYDLWLSKIPQ